MENTEPIITVQNGETVVHMEPAVQARSGFKTSPVTPMSHRAEVKAYGTVITLPDVSDLISRYHTALADLKRANANSLTTQAALKRAKANLLSSEGILSKATANLDVTQVEYQRLKRLNEDNKNISDKMLESATASVALSQSDVQTARASIQVNHADIQSSEGSIQANRADQMAAQGALQSIRAAAIQRLGPTLSDWMFRSSPEFQKLLARQNVIIQVNFPVEAGFTKPPERINVKSENGKVFSIRYVSPALQTDPHIQEQSYYYLASAEQEGLFPGMSLLANFPIQKTVNGFLVPQTAVVWWQGKSWMYLQKDKSHFVRKEVSTEIPVTGGWFAGEAMPKEQVVVVTGAELLLTEEFKAQMQASAQAGTE